MEKDSKDEIPAPEDIPLETKDGVLLKATFYAGTNGKTSIPIVIVHDHDHEQNGQRTDYHDLALYLQKNGGHAVIVPDLRGHGESTKYRKPSGDIGETDKSKFKTGDFANMVLDLQAVKKFLREKNNAGELNLEQICVIGVGGLGSITALNWAYLDWTQPILIGYKMGQDVKALVLVSPTLQFEGIKSSNALAHKAVGGTLATMLVGGKKDPDLIPIHRQFEGKHKKTTNLMDKDLFKIQLTVEVKGAKLLDPSLGLGLEKTILNFIDLKLVKKADEMPWSERKTPR